MARGFHLTTIRFSHFNEKARWGLDWLGIPFTEHPYMPLFHFLPAAVASRFRGRSDKHSTRFSTPILRTDRGEIFCDSTDILQYLSQRFGTPKTDLFPNAEAAELQRYWSYRLAPASRSFAYAAGLGDRRLLAYLAEKNVPPLQAKLFKAFSPL